MIKKALLTFASKFWLLLIRYRLCPTASDNLLTWEGPTFTASMMVGYDINLAAIFQSEIYERAFREVATFYFFILFRDYVMMLVYQIYWELMREYR